MGRKKKRRSGKSITQQAFKWIRVGSFVAPAFKRYSDISGDPLRKIGGTLQSYGGINMAGQFDGNLLTRMWLPYVVTSAITHGVPKLIGILRRL